MSGAWIPWALAVGQYFVNRLSPAAEHRVEIVGATPARADRAGGDQAGAKVVTVSIASAIALYM